MTGILPPDIANAPSPEGAAKRLGEALGLNGPAPMEATRRALSEALYAKALWSSRKIPALRDQLLAAAGQMRISGGADDTPTNAQLVAKSIKGALKWGMEGLKPAAPWVIQRRLDACLSCPHNVPAPDKLVYRGAKVAVGKDARICDACHCLINTKSAISTEHCPEKHPSQPELSRWEEPWVPPEKHPKGPW